MSRGSESRNQLDGNEWAGWMCVAVAIRPIASFFVNVSKDDGERDHCREHGGGISLLKVQG